MPIFDYQCTECGHEFEAIQKISDPVLTDCPECGKATLKKMVSAPSFRLKGGGWYETDFKGSKKSAASKETTSDKSSGSSHSCGGGGCGCK
ncbi:MAG: zinc ribbon domain-containing protein [Gammaproteobacteria bacterium]|nr:zinc ribbon domain-containing protein [Gammaproteobacteria bacterium]MDH5594910.1 zinc ribbon domain-containing protein [Gammaproteobacteria bacterium]MDH5613842.1 zinc ribbon domain-containing protein [Gammaproteobacteria bacterium]